VTPEADGTLYLLDQLYAGAPDGLSSSVPGFIASTSTIAGGIWDFDASVTVAADTTYYMYEDTPIVLTGDATSPSSDQFYSFSGSSSGDFVAVSGADVNFNFSGSTATPEPGTLLLTGLLLVPAGLFRLRRTLL
jgi:hypothetical protein